MATDACQKVINDDWKRSYTGHWLAMTFATVFPISVFVFCPPNPILRRFNLHSEHEKSRNPNTRNRSGSAIAMQGIHIVNERDGKNAIDSTSMLPQSQAPGPQDPACQPRQKESPASAEHGPQDRPHQPGHDDVPETELESSEAETESDESSDGDSETPAPVFCQCWPCKCHSSPYGQKLMDFYTTPFVKFIYHNVVSFPYSA